MDSESYKFTNMSGGGVYEKVIEVAMFLSDLRPDPPYPTTSAADQVRLTPIKHAGLIENPL